MRSVWVVAGGVVGSLLRWWLAGLFPATPPAFPWGTLLVNVTGAFALGAVGVVLIERVVARSDQLRTFLAIGLLGSYTTFSTMAVEGGAVGRGEAADEGRRVWVATLVLGQMAGVYGMWLGRLRLPR